MNTNGLKNSYFERAPHIVDPEVWHHKRLPCSKLKACKVPAERIMPAQDQNGFSVKTTYISARNEVIIINHLRTFIRDRALFNGSWRVKASPWSSSSESNCPTRMIRGFGSGIVLDIESRIDANFGCALTHACSHAPQACCIDKRILTMQK